MSFILGIIGAIVLSDAFGASHWGSRQQWEVATGFVFIAAACIVYWASDGDD